MEFRRQEEKFEILIRNREDRTVFGSNWKFVEQKEWVQHYRKLISKWKRSSSLLLFLRSYLTSFKIIDTKLFSLIFESYQNVHPLKRRRNFFSKRFFVSKHSKTTIKADLLISFFANYRYLPSNRRFVRKRRKCNPRLRIKTNARSFKNWSSKILFMWKKNWHQRSVQ